MANIISGLLFLLGASAASSNNYNQAHPRSCKQILAANKGAQSGLYTITASVGNLQVFCDMKLGGGGFTFLPRTAASFLTDGDLENMFTDRSKVLLRLQKADGRQSYTLIEQMAGYTGQKISLQRDQYHGYTSPVNRGRLGHFLYLGLIPVKLARRRGTLQGFKSNGQVVRFRNCDANPNSFFAFFENANERIPSPYHNGNLVYEKAGVAVAWRKTGIPVNSLRNIPNEFFFLTELHFGGCGTYTSSDRWRDCIGTAIGIR